MLTICCFLNTKLQVERLNIKLLQRSFFVVFLPISSYVFLKEPATMCTFYVHFVKNFILCVYVVLNQSNTSFGGVAALSSYMVQKPPKRQKASGAAALSLICFKNRQNGQSASGAAALSPLYYMLSICCF